MSADSGNGVRRTPDGKRWRMRAKSTSFREALTTSLSAPSAPGGAGDHKVVDDPAIFVEQLGIALTTGSEVEKIGRAERFEKARNGCVVAALDQRLTHMRNVEQASSLASMEVLGEDPGRVLDRHVVARERRHARAKLDMQGVERRLLVELRSWARRS